ncbi:hypothetical protein [Bordetella genomosp. 11]|uniref:Uncharacterized protein n=1 Tax=Bordetella genomosp. 11 TaxID=1416808 RepID=A0A261UIA3_9BORD|nr:hypothetical protein [Bordetella genomosp. 11]OZI61321.1 hypothetical protein CAL28_18560 [Bordetella genomosp. 11]
MPMIVVARFDTLPDAASAAHALVGEGFREDAVCVFRAGEPGERWSGRRVRAAIARTAALGAAGAAVGVATTTVMAIPDPYSVLIAAVGALAGSLAAAVVTHLERRGDSDGALPPQAAFVAVVTGTGQEAKGTQLLHDAGGRSMERLRGGRQILSELVRGHEGMEGPFRRRFPIS